MKKLILESRDDKTVLTSKYFDLVTESGIGIENTPWSGYQIISKGLAKDWVVEIRLNSNNPEFKGEPVRYKYHSSYISYGMRGDGNHDIEEFISVLEFAIDFKKEVDEYLELR
jgi:hypothetical protein